MAQHTRTRTHTAEEKASRGRSSVLHGRHPSVSCRAPRAGGGRLLLQVHPLKVTSQPISATTLVDSPRDTGAEGCCPQLPPWQLQISPSFLETSRLTHRRLPLPCCPSGQVPLHPPTAHSGPSLSSLTCRYCPGRLSVFTSRHDHAAGPTLRPGHRQARNGRPHGEEALSLRGTRRAQLISGQAGVERRPLPRGTDKCSAPHLQASVPFQSTQLTGTL